MNQKTLPRRAIPRHQVVLLRADDKELPFVVRAIMDLTRFAKEEATHKMWEAYHAGRSLLLVTHLERAELYREQFADRGLAVALEPV